MMLTFLAWYMPFNTSGGIYMPFNTSGGILKLVL